MKAFLRSGILLCGLALFACGDEDPPDAQAPHWQISARYIADTMMLSNQALAARVIEGRYHILAPPAVHAGVLTQFRRMARRMQLRPLPLLYLTTGDREPVPQAAARMTREGGPYIVINRSALFAWSDAQLTAVLGHELVHLKARHVTAESMAEAYNHPEISVAHEMEADHIGAGELGSCDPGALLEALEIVQQANRHFYPGDGALENLDDAGELARSSHPAWKERKAALEAQKIHPRGRCARRRLAAQ